MDETSIVLEHSLTSGKKKVFVNGEAYHEEQSVSASWTDPECLRPRAAVDRRIRLSLPNKRSFDGSEHQENRR